MNKELKKGIRKMSVKYPDSSWRYDWGRQEASLNQWVGGTCLAVDLSDKFVRRENKRFIELFGDHRWFDRETRSPRTAMETGIVMYLSSVFKNLGKG